jgi:hypothetical protein
VYNSIVNQLQERFEFQSTFHFHFHMLALFCATCACRSQNGEAILASLLSFKKAGGAKLTACNPDGSYKSIGECCKENSAYYGCSTLESSCRTIIEDGCEGKYGCSEAEDICDQLCEGAEWDFCGGLPGWAIAVIVIVVLIVVGVVIGLCVYFLWYKPKKEKEAKIADGQKGGGQQPGYDAPQQGYAAPPPVYVVQQGYAAPGPSYGDYPPQPGYGPPQGGPPQGGPPSGYGQQSYPAQQAY